MTFGKKEASPKDWVSLMEKAPYRRDWVGLLAPTLLAVVVGLAIQVGGYVWFMATLNGRVANIELRIKVNEDELRSLPIDYVPRAEHAKADALLREQREDDQHRLDRLEAKIDLLPGECEETVLRYVYALFL